MKSNLITVLLILLTGLIHAQSKYAYAYGLDSAALKYGLKSKTTFTVKSYGATIDTADFTQTYFNDKGFITKYSENHRNSISFGYNDAGYLIYENYNWGGPVGYNPDTLFRTELVVYEEFGNTSRITEEYRSDKYATTEYSTRNTYTYDSLGRIATQHCVRMYGYEDARYTWVYSYDESNRLVTMTDDRKKAQKEYLYNSDSLVIEIKHHERGMVYRREITIYEYY